VSHLGISNLNQLQNDVLQATYQHIHVIAPTGSGKTVAFLLPVLSSLDVNNKALRALIVVPMRELALQIAQVFTQMQTGYKCVCCYGGHNMQAEVRSLQQTPTLIIGTPGRLQKHISLNNIDTSHLKVLVLDEFDKSLEIGFAESMQTIVASCNNTKIILTSATAMPALPDFLKHYNWHYIRSEHQIPEITCYSAKVLGDDKAEALLLMLNSFAAEPAIVFCNHRDAAQRLSSFMQTHKISHSLYHGKLEQQQREMAWIQFANGSNRLLITTDLASRGLDIARVKHIIHYQLPQTAETNTHRNGRTARMQATGNAYYLLDKGDVMPLFITAKLNPFQWPQQMQPWPKIQWVTLYIASGKKDGLSKTDVLGVLYKKASFQKNDLGLMSVFDHFILIAITANLASIAWQTLTNYKVKNKKVKVSLLP
ncbi:MAG TPA: DEAD/DEAH box helicase, partial [Bacteroidia bacterium]|nr:DEAD/DEAH box helicase [Bacteroidia bacterium]